MLYKAASSTARSPVSEVERWDLVRWPADSIEELSFSPTVVRRTAQMAGDALWTASPSEAIRIGIAFAWEKAPPGVLLLSDPLTVASNVLLFDAHGRLVPEHIMQAHLAWLVGQTRWQTHLQQVLAS